MVKVWSIFKQLPGDGLLLTGALAASVSFVLLLYCFFDPLWETNDDVAMSMVAHGYGISAQGSPHLVFSNVIWGYLVRSLPEINGVLGYSLLTLGVLVIVGTIVIYSFFRLGAGHAGCLAALALILTRPVLFPQFTINAGLLMVGAILCWHLYARRDDLRLLVVGCLLAFCSYLVRSQEFLLVLAVGLPLLPWRTFLTRRSAKIALAVLISAMALSTTIDHLAYNGAEWKAFSGFNRVRVPFTDFGAGKILRQRPDILEKYGYSSNDIDLIENWFFADRRIADPDALGAMLERLGPLPARETAVADAWRGVQTLWHPTLLPLVLAALFLAILYPSWQAAASWVLCIAAVFAVGFLGCPGVLRIYVPLVSLLLVSPFLKGQVSRSCMRLGVGVLVMAAAFNVSDVLSRSRISQSTAEQIRHGLAAFPNYPVVVWGDVFPFESVYPVLGASSSAMSYRLYSLAVFSPAPFSVAFTEQREGRDVIHLLLSEKGVPIVANEKHFSYLETYCREHFRGRIKELSRERHGEVVVAQLRCEAFP